MLIVELNKNLWESTTTNNIKEENLEDYTNQKLMEKKISDQNEEIAKLRSQLEEARALLRSIVKALLEQNNAIGKQAEPELEKLEDERRPDTGTQ
tara:strand:+ start:3871 stop:4155 length:285 start_codon:yes stop_codon:yes gene_type:complete